MEFEKNWKSVSEENSKIDTATDQRIWQNITNKIAARKKVRAIYWSAAILIPFFGGVFFYKSNVDALPVKQHQITVVETQETDKKIRLSDGSIITLKSNSRLTLDENFGKKVRYIKFEGEGFFDIAKNKDKPFIVDAKDFKIQVLGTKFFLNQKPKNKKVELLEGKVKIEHTGKYTYLLPKEIWMIDSQNNDYHYYSKEINKTFSFENQNYSEVISILEKTYNVKITYPSKFQNKKISGSFTGNFEEILSIISYPFNLKPNKINEEKIILK